MKNIDNEEIVFSETYKVTYIDALFVGLRALNYDFDEYKKKDMLPSDIGLNDEINEYFNRKTRKRTFEIKLKAGGEKLSKNLYKDVDFSEWVVRCIYNHTVCLYNLYNFEEKRYVSDCNLELNANIGDIFFCKTKNNKDDYIFDKKRNSTLALKYAHYFGEIDTISLKNNKQTISELEKEIMKKFDKENTELFNAKFKQKFVNTYNLSEKEGQDQNGNIVYRAYDIDDNEKAISADKLPSNAREGDYIGITEFGEYQFDRKALIKAIKSVERLAIKAGGK